MDLPRAALATAPPGRASGDLGGVVGRNGVVGLARGQQAQHIVEAHQQPVVHRHGPSGDEDLLAALR